MLGRFDEAVQTYQQMVDLTSHANGAYTDEEKNNRSIFLERLGAVYLEENKTDQAVAAYQKMIDMGGSSVARGYQGQVDAYRDAHQFDKAIEVSRKAVAADPKDRDLKLMLAGELADQGKPDEGLAMAKSLLDGATPDEQRGVWFAIGQMDIRLHRWKDAEDAFNTAEPLATKKEDRTYLFFLRGELAERQKHLEPAEQYFRQALDLDPDNAMTLNYLGYMWADKGIKLPEALKMIKQGRGSGADEWRLSGFIGLGLLQDGRVRAGRGQPAPGRQSRPDRSRRFTCIWAISTRRQGASGWQRRSGRCRWPILPSQRLPTLSRATWPRCRRSWKARARSWPRRKAPWARSSRSSSGTDLPLPEHHTILRN